MRRRSRTLVIVALCAASFATGAALLPADAGSPAPQPVGEAAGVCDPIDPANCLLPFPNDFFTVGDSTTSSGRRVNMSPLALPTNVAGVPWDTTEWNRNDGFSPGSPILTRVAGLDLRRTWSMTDDQITDLARSLRPNAPIVLLDATTGKRHPFWSELDTHPATTDDERLLIVRPASNLTEGHRYVIALRSMRDSAGNLIPPGASFAALRDKTPSSAPVEARRPAMERVFTDLASARVPRGDLYLAWDFTIASERNLTERVLAMRDDAFAQLGDTTLADRTIQGRSPTFTITSVTDFTPEQNRATARTVLGTIAVPNYLTPQASATMPEPARAGADDALDTAKDNGIEVPSPADTATDVVTDSKASLAAPGSRLLYGTNGLPMQNPAQPTVDVPFDCHLPHAARVPDGSGRADGALYGHGLLGTRGEAGGSSTEDLRLRGFAVCAIDWWGMSIADIGNIALILTDMSLFPSLADRAQQGFLNFLYLGRALAHAQGFAGNPAFQDASGHPLLKTGSIVYDGNSQGAIMGGALTALAPDFRRATLGVAGMNYSTLLNRSVDWEGSYAVVAYTTYPDSIDQQLMYALAQMIWDRAEANGYAHHMTSKPLADTPAHQVMLQIAYADHQVANVAAEVEARTIGARLAWPALGPESPHWSINPQFGFAKARYGRPTSDSVLIYWYSADRGNKVPPNGNIPPSAGGDPHGDPRKDNLGSDQVANWFRTGVLLDVCGGPCVTTDATRRN
jgi:hypothetical protein